MFQKFGSLNYKSLKAKLLLISQSVFLCCCHILFEVPNGQEKSEIAWHLVMFLKDCIKPLKNHLEVGEEVIWVFKFFLHLSVTDTVYAHYEFALHFVLNYSRRKKYFSAGYSTD